MWYQYITFFLFILNIPLIQFSAFIYLLSWLFYNFKSFKFNKLVSLFKKVFCYIFEKNLIIEMASSSSFCYNFCWNPLINLVDNKFASNLLDVVTKSNNCLAPISRGLFCDFTLALSTLKLDFTLILNNQIGKYIHNNLQKSIKLTLKLFF